MSAVVVDASILVSAFLRDGRTRERLMAPGRVRFVAPAIIAQEVRTHLPVLAARAGLDAGAAGVLFDVLLGNLRLLDEAAYRPFLEAATAAARKAEAWNDEPYVAIAMMEGLPVWTLDKDFSRIRGIRAVSTAEVEAMAE